MRVLRTMALLVSIVLPSGVQGGEVQEMNRTPGTSTGTHALSEDGSAALDPAFSPRTSVGQDAQEPIDSGETATATSSASSNANPVATWSASSNANSVVTRGPAPVLGGAAPETSPTRPSNHREPAAASSDPAAPGRLEYLVPELEGRTFSLPAGPRTFLHRLSFSPGFGRLGDEPVYTFRVAYNPNSWLGWEGSLSHNQGESVHALFHMLNVQLRYPVPFRLQPYASGGFGIVMVFPGASVNADPVTENALAAGGGLELYLRDDVALRGEWRRISVFGRDPYTRQSVVYPYEEATLGLTFYRRIEP